VAWKFNGMQAVFLQIADKLRCDIVNGVYLPDTQIPTVRQLAFDASVNPNTMQRALSLLEEEGLLVSRGTVGRFVTSDPEVIENAGKKICFQTVERFCREAQALGISREELMDYIKEVGIYE
jgi:DNA-binding transcriptional regulator YhcF (GntR family)